MNKTSIFGLGFDAVTIDQAVIQVMEKANRREKCLIVTPNVDHIVMLESDADLLQIYRFAAHVYADGMPIVWFSKLFLKEKLPERVTGADLMPKICEAASGTRKKIYFLGGAPGSAQLAALNLTNRHPGLEIAGTYAPPFGFEHDPQECSKIVSQINQTKADILFVGVGTPKQEKWIYKHFETLNVGPILGVGAAFDFAAGKVKRAPRFMRQSGLEFLWRLLKEPRRLWRRYLFRDIKFAVIAWREAFVAKS